MGNNASSNDYGKSHRKAVGHLNEAPVAERQRSRRSSSSRKFIAEAVAAAAAPAPAATEAETEAKTTKTTRVPREAKRINAAEESAAITAAQQLKQISTWSLGSLSGRWNWSINAASKHSFRNRNNKSTRKSLTSLQERRSKTTWHKPIANAIFSSHFKESSRNEQFHIDHLIAKGAFGVVFKVIDKQHQQKIATSNDSNSDYNHPGKALSSILTSTSTTSVYALKVLKKSKVIEQSSIQQIKDEADIQKICGHHPFIVQQVDLWQNRHNLHILSEYVPNGELFSKIVQFSIDLARIYLAEIALALDFLHNAGIIYRDAKPENILLTETFHIKLTDFGLSKWLRLGATTNTMCGTFQYMAPEILRGETYGHAVDWWSLGVILCQMLTQQSPDIKEFLTVALPSHLMASCPTHLDDVDNIAHTDTNTDTIRTNTVAGAKEVQRCFLPKDVENLPHSVKDAIKRLLEIDPKQRLRSVLALQKIALYQKFKIDSKHLQSISVLDIISRDNIILHSNERIHESCSTVNTNTFQGF